MLPLYRPKDLLVCLPGCPWFINSSNIFAWLVFFETVQICKNKGDAAGVFEGKFFTDNLIAWQQLKRWLVLSWNYLLVGFRRLCQLLYRNPCFLWFQCWLETRNSVWTCLNLVPKLDPKLVPKRIQNEAKMGLSILASFLVPILGPIWVPILVPILAPILCPILVPILGPLWLQIKFFLWLLIAL